MTHIYYLSRWPFNLVYFMPTWEVCPIPSWGVTYSDLLGQQVSDIRRSLGASWSLSVQGSRAIVGTVIFCLVRRCR